MFPKSILASSYWSTCCEILWQVRRRSSCIRSATTALFIELQLLLLFQEAENPLPLRAGSAAGTVLQHWSWRTHLRTPNCGFALKNRTFWLTNSSVSTTVPKLVGRGRGRSNHPSADGEMLHPFGNRLFPGDVFQSSQASSLPLSSIRLRKMSIISVYPIISTYSSRRHSCGTGISNASAWADGRALGQPKARAGWVVVGTTTHTHTHRANSMATSILSVKPLCVLEKHKLFFLFF